MNFETIKMVSARALGRGVLLTKKHAPEILTGLGVVGGITAAVLAAKASTTLNDDLADTRELISNRKILREDMDENEYPTNQYQRDLAVAYAFHVRKIAKIYGPSVLLGTASVICILAAHGIMQKRQTSLVAAYSTLDAAFKAYRKRVVEEFGEEKDWDFRHGIREETVEKTDESGKTTKKKVLVQDQPSEYAVLFDESNFNWGKNAESNLHFLLCQQNYMNNLLRAHGHLFLNEVYDALGMERTSAGAVVGWLVGKGGDDYVDFGLYRGTDPKKLDFLNGDERSVWLDFNVDGVIWDKI